MAPLVVKVMASGAPNFKRYEKLCRGFPLDTVGVSPLFGDHKGLPPLLLQVAENEPMRDDSIQFHKRALAAGVDSRLEVFGNAFHDFQVFTQLPEALAAIDKIAAFFRETVIIFRVNPCFMGFFESVLSGVDTVSLDGLPSLMLVQAPVCVVANFIRHFFP